MKYKLLTLFFCFLISNSFANKNLAIQQREVTGKVTNDQGEALIGVNVSIKDTKTSTFTNENGVYSIILPQRSPTLVFSTIGYTTQERTVQSNVINVVMKASIHNLNEVVVIGYGEQTRADLTGSVASVKAAEIVQSGNVDLLGSLQGKVSGVRINSQSGEPGAGMNIQIRGASSLYGSSSPLFVIDGVPFDLNPDEMADSEESNLGHSVNPLSDIDPNSVESIEVLKDASATAIYGSRGANGVVLITTKSGTPGKSSITYHGYTSFSSAANKMALLSGDEWIDYQRIVRPNSSLFYEVKDGVVDLDSPINPYSFQQRDWQEEAFRNAITQSHSLSFRGGNKETTFAGSAAYINQEGIVHSNDFDRYNLQLKVDHNHSQKLKLGVNLIGSYQILEGATNTGLANSANGIVQRIIMSRPIEYYDPSTDDDLTQFISPLSMVNNAYKSAPTMRTTASMYAEYKFTPHLKLNILGGGRLSSSKGKMFYSKYSTWGNLNNGAANLQERKSVSWNSTARLNYLKRFNRIHEVDLMGAFEVSQYDYEYQSMRSTDFLDESTGVDDISKGALVTNVGSSKWTTSRVSWLTRANYSLLWRYLFTASFRIDGSDKFGPGNRYGYFPSLAFAWQIHKEKFMKSLEDVNELKLRLSYGQTGNERIPAYRYFSEMSNAFYASAGCNLFGMAPTSLANPDLKWETTIQYNAGLDIGLFKNRLSFTADYYIKQTKDMLLPAYIPSEKGYSQQWTNIGRIDNSGVEFQLKSVNIQKENFNWTSSFNISMNKNTIKSLGDLDFIPVILENGSIPNLGRVNVGNSLGTAYGYIWDGIYQIDDFVWQDNSDPSIPHASRDYILKDGVPSVAGATVQPGGHKFKDLNGDGIVNDDHDRTFISRSLPKHIGGLTNNFSYKNFGLDIFLEWSYGGELINLGKRLVEGPGGGAWNLTQDFWENHWSPENPTNSHPDFLINNPTSNKMSSYYVEDGSYLRLGNVSLSYNLPGNIVSKIGFNSVKVYVKANNLHVWTNYSSFDPDVSFSNTLLPGIDNLAYPRPRSFLAGLIFSL